MNVCLDLWAVSQSVSDETPIGQSLNVSEKQPGNYQTPGCPDFSHDCHQGPAVILERRKQRGHPCCSIEEKTTPVMYGCAYGCMYVCMLAWGVNTNCRIEKYTDDGM